MTSEGPSDRFSGIRAVETAADILGVLAKAPGPLTLTDLSAQCGLSPAKAHRYLVSMVSTDMVVHRRSGLYDLGPLAADIGLAALARISDVNHYSDMLPALVDTTGLSALLAVWTRRGPTVLRLEGTEPRLRYAVGPGSTLDLLGNTVGAAFLHHLSDRFVRPVLAAELQIDPSALDLDRYRQAPDGDQLFRGAFTLTPPGTHTVTRPMLDLHGDVRCVISVITPHLRDIEISSEACAALLRL